MAKKTSEEQTGSEKIEVRRKTQPVEGEPASAPVLGKAGRTTPQLITSTKSTKVEPVRPEEPAPWFETDESADTAPADRPDPVVRAYGEPIADRDDEDNDHLNEHVADPSDPDGVYADKPEPRWQQTQKLQPAPQPKRAKAKKRHPFLKTLLFLIILAAATAGAYWYGNHAADKNKPAPATTSQQSAPATTSTPKPVTTAATKHYDSSNFLLNFDYPGDWKLTDTTSKLTVVSPSLQAQGADGTAKTVHVVLSIQPKQTSIPSYPSSGATAELSSTRITYTKPSSEQRAATYLSYLGYGTTSGLDALFVTGDNGYQQNQVVPQSDITKADPLISVSFLTCSDDSCASSSSTSQTLLASKWQSLPVAKTITSIVQSIQLD